MQNETPLQLMAKLWPAMFKREGSMNVDQTDIWRTAFSRTDDVTACSVLRELALTHKYASIKPADFLETLYKLKPKQTSNQGENRQHRTVYETQREIWSKHPDGEISMMVGRASEDDVRIVYHCHFWHLCCERYGRESNYAIREWLLWQNACGESLSKFVSDEGIEAYKRANPRPWAGGVSQLLREHFVDQARLGGAA